MEYSYLNDTLVILTATVAVVFLVLRIGLPPLVAYLTVGVLVGPYTLGLVSDVEHIRTFAEFGVVFLLFTIGLEFSATVLTRMKASVLGLGSAQVLLTAALTTTAAIFLGLPLESALVIGAVVAMSSTALVTKQLADQVELHTRHGRNSVGILLFQDLMVVPFLILVSMLSGNSVEASSHIILTALGQGVLVIMLIFAFGHWVLSPLFQAVARFRSAELFTLTVLLLVLCSAWLTNQIGLTFALGAFLAGMMLSETEFKHQVASDIRPFRDVLLGLFFVTIGMMLEVPVLPEIWSTVLLMLLALILIKFLLVAVFCLLAGWNSAVSMRTGLILAHGGEFGFAILILAMEGNILSPIEGQILLATMLFSMVLAPIIIRYNAKITTLLIPKQVQRSRQEIKSEIISNACQLNQHVIICGYGRIGQHSVNYLSEHHIPCMAIDLDSVRVKNGMAGNKSVSYGDACSLELLHACGLHRASALVISMIDFNTAMKIISRVRSVDAELPIIVRTRKELHLYQFYQAGATEVVADTFGSDQMIDNDLLTRIGLKKTSEGLSGSDHLADIFDKA
ncbi:MAG: cation:proton antiporter [Mariprofundus sp.]|nr:cation:proton antiporter [Mariprofundus sp.]